MKGKDGKRKGKLLLIILAIVVGVAGIIFGSINIANGVLVNNKIKKYEGKVTAPKVDFIQHWLTEDWEIADWEEHFDNLSQAGYDTLIWQFTRYGGVGASNVFYPTTALSTVYDGAIYQDKTYMLERMFTVADSKGFKIFLGLSIDEEWWSWKGYANEEYLTKQAEIDNVMIDELYALYNHHSSFYGWYWSHELLTNIHNYEVAWANMLNKTIAKLDSLGDNRPLLFSPFIHKLLRGTSNDTYKMWVNFFEIVNFREGDIFCPQDSIGKISRGDATTTNLAMTYRYVESCKRAADKFDGLEFWVNCELFATPSMSNETDLFTAELDRIKYQYAIASQFADTLVTFSYSHYFAPKGNEGSTQLHTAYCEYVQSLE